MNVHAAWMSAISVGANGIFDMPADDFLTRTKQDKLPQARIILEALKHLQKSELEEAYLRGSFSSGEADIHSDIDLFLVVDPAKLEQTFNDFCDFLNKKYPAIVMCHDKLVKDYGGIGFMFICEGPGGQPFQFDFYMAMKDVPPKETLFNSPRIYRRDAGYSWLEECGNDKPLPAATQAFIDRHTANQNVEESAEQAFKDLMIAALIMSKHVKRGQMGRALNDNNHAIGMCVELLQKASQQPPCFHSSLYAADQLIIDLKGGHDPRLARYARQLEALLVAPPSQQKVEDFYDLAKGVIHDYFPSVYQRNANSLARYERMALAQPQPASFVADKKPTYRLGA